MKEMKKGLLILLLWVSGAWKNTMMQMLLKNHTNYKQLLSYKTRPLREWETNGVDYNYVTDEEFHEAIENNMFLEYAKVHDMYFYGTKKSDILNGLDTGDIMIKEIEINGVKNILEFHPDVYKHTLRIFLDLSDDTMVQRITRRAVVSQGELQNRLTSAIWEREQAKIYCQYVISAEGTKEEVYERLEKIINEYLK